MKERGVSCHRTAAVKTLLSWINWWVSKLGEWSIEPSQLCLYLTDEPRTTAQDQIIIAYANSINAAQPEVVIVETPHWNPPSSGTFEMFESCRVLCPHLPMWIDSGVNFANFYIQQQQAGRRLWFYSARGPGRLLDPYAYSRLQQWFCWKYGAEGSYFWSFMDSTR